MTKPCLTIWQWNDAPETYKAAVAQGGDEDWLLYCPAALVDAHWPMVLSEAITGEENSYIDGFHHIKRYEFKESGDVIISFAHA